MVKYSITTKIIIVEETAYMTYGINCSENGKSIARIDDISTKREEIEKTVKAFNDNRLAPEQFKDAVEDSIV